ncbi:Glutamate--cysteine ligase (Gamma-ECS) (GCS) (Gamma-glutamylcysteine synthetase) [Durusdinium trenchii]|uniref:Glutamate--cysteine ligase n=1 Tax=Durusdinium trenchii TaxID=1381693 RepID=A0ABP0R556_9DINO
MSVSIFHVVNENACEISDFKEKDLLALEPKRKTAILMYVTPYILPATLDMKRRDKRSALPHSTTGEDQMAQATDFENAAVIAVARVLAQMILEEGWDLYVPISTVEENLRRTEGVGAVTRQRFLFRDDFLGGESSGIQEFSLEEILFGANEKGVFSRCLNFMQKKHSEGLCAAQTVQRFSRYVELFRRRCRSELPTPAAWLRRRLAAHQAYAGGSLVPREFVKDMAMLAASLSQRPRPPAAAEALAELLGDLAGED